MEKETVLAALREHKTRREASDFAPDSGPGGDGQSGEQQPGVQAAGDQWPLLAGPRPRGSEETRDGSGRRGPPAGKGGGHPAFPPKSCPSA